MSTKQQDARVRLTKSVIDNLAIPTSGQRIYRDSDLVGFAVRVTPSGTKTFVIEKRINGRVRRIKLGRYGELTPAQARNHAQALLGQIAMGVDPQVERRRERARGVTLREVYRDYLQTRKNLSPRTIEGYDRAVNVIFKDWLDRPMRSLSRAMIVKRHRNIAETRGEQAANNYMRALRALFSFAMDFYEDGSGEPAIADNPVLVLTRRRAWYAVDRRQTVIKPHELEAWYLAVESLRESEHPDSLGDTVADLLLFILFTGLRRTEAATLTWDDVDLTGRSFTIGKTKNGRPHSLPLPDNAYDLLVRRSVIGKSRYVFAGKDGHSRIIEPKRQIAKVVETSGIRFTPHDLRRTFLTIASIIDLSGYTIKRLANHSMKSDVTAGYIVSDIEQLREPMQRIENYLLSAMGITENKIVTLPTQSKK